MASKVKAITQETFDCVVKENIDDFEMSRAEAISDAIDQFQSQGVNLSMIIKEVPTSEGHQVFVLVEKLKKLVENGNAIVEQESVKELLDQLSRFFKKDLAKRYQASKIADAHRVLYKACQKYKDTQEMLKCCLQAFICLLDGQPDLITGEGLQFALNLLQNSDDPEMVTLLLRILRLSCTKQEQNRLELVSRDGIPALLSSAEKFKDEASVIRSACGALRALTLDDDVRVTCGKAHDHTKLIVMEHLGLERLFALLQTYENDATVASEIYSTLGKLLVRSEFCQQAVDLGGLEVISKTFNVHIDKQNVIRQGITLLKAMSCNDDVKVAVVKAGGIELLLNSLSKHKANPQICEACFAALTTLALRNPSHCDIIMANNAALSMTEAMKEHSDHAGLQKQACMAIRNLVARTRYHSKVFIENGAEGLIRNARAKHNKVLEDEAKAALRDLDVKVELQERWKGENEGVTS